ncbi:MAG: DegT/DnrJ/EryC1/StrS family aminotransferase, partial [Spirochaetota bacterium]
MKPVPFIDLHAQYLAYKDEIDAAITRVVTSGGFVQGPEVAALEEELGAYLGVDNVVTCASGTDALFIALRALGIGPGDEVITTGFSFFATASTIVQAGAHPVFADIDPRTCNLDPGRIDDAITPATKAIVPVGLYGQPSNMEEICAIASRHDLVVIEDAAQSFGGAMRGRRSGSFGTVGCTSFYPAKP